MLDNAGPLISVVIRNDGGVCDERLCTLWSSLVVHRADVTTDGALEAAFNAGNDGNVDSREKSAQEADIRAEATAGSGMLNQVGRDIFGESGGYLRAVAGGREELIGELFEELNSLAVRDASSAGAEGLVCGYRSE